MSREMVNSGVPWIGEIPKGWMCPKNKFFTRISSGDGISNEELKDEGDYEVWGGGNSIMGYYNCYNVDNDNLIIGRVGACGYVKRSNGKRFISDNALIMRITSKSLDFNYLYHVLTSAELSRLNTSTAQPLITATKVYNVAIPIPPLVEQQRIASFLDRKCAEIDEMIALQEKIVEELKAYKQSVIAEAITKGLNPDAPMKDSGIKWIGKIPEHWKIEPLKYNFNRRSERNNPIKTIERLSLSIDKGVTLYSEKTTNLDRFKDDFTQYQLAYPNDIVLNCMNMIVGAVGLSQYMGCVSPVYYVIYPSKSAIDAEYYSYLLNTPTIRGVYYSYGKGIYAIERGEGRVNTCRLKVSYDDFGRFNIPIPPLDEQKDIVRYIKGKCSQIDSLINIKQSKIDSLKEYKKSIIYEYVTGKKEVTE